MSEHTHLVDGKEFKIKIDKGVTQIDAPYLAGLKHRYKLVLFYANEEEKVIRVVFNCQLITEDELTLINQQRVEFTLSDWDYDYFENNLGIPVIKSAVIDGLLKYHLNIPKFFNPIDDEPEATTEDKSANI